ncbi:acyltransferase [Pectobacterium brasiliense]|uniref:acyltransferase n=1 Tax=Pectobacterium brasiliense TaxID=180957 RepID=UPI0004E6A9EA|nr:acyltransferase [Pectobacterium brasiliense]KFF63337.1 transferase [Pectobacterium brasiliense]MBN3043985.1 acyltransferase [Pectobacterium brasiliense]MBN3097721.1 acyltransferase [Pectobacterium brasiliense]MBN3101196.1 acyltransferase [Pectobacterium brasiliense]MBN3122575.1 acyltransferase [Pectobacterium brasiliense]
MFGKILRLYYSFKYKFFLDKEIIISKTSFIHNEATFIIEKKSNAEINIGNDVYIGRCVNIHTGSLIKIGDFSVLSDYVYISTLSHGFEPGDGPIMQQGSYDKGPIILGKNVFVGFGVKIMPNVEIGDWTIIGSGAVVTKSLPGYCMVVGNPAKIIKLYDKDKREWVRKNDLS